VVVGTITAAPAIVKTTAATNLTTPTTRTAGVAGQGQEVPPRPWELPPLGKAGPQTAAGQRSGSEGEGLAEGIRRPVLVGGVIPELQETIIGAVRILLRMTSPRQTPGAISGNLLTVQVSWISSCVGGLDTTGYLLAL